eukprot:803652-Pelagomonas_calceolata.AAC.9
MIACERNFEEEAGDTQEHARAVTHHRHGMPLFCACSMIACERKFEEEAGDTEKRVRAVEAQWEANVAEIEAQWGELQYNKC